MFLTNGQTHFQGGRGGRTHNVTQRTDTQIFLSHTNETDLRTKPYIEAARCLKNGKQCPEVMRSDYISQNKFFALGNFPFALPLQGKTKRLLELRGSLVWAL